MLNINKQHYTYMEVVLTLLYVDSNTLIIVNWMYGLYTHTDVILDVLFIHPHCCDTGCMVYTPTLL